MNFKNIYTILILSFLTATVYAQTEKADTVIIPLAKSSKVIFVMEDRSDLEVLKQYNFQDMFMDVLKKIEASDSLNGDTARRERVVRVEVSEDHVSISTDEKKDDDKDESEDDKWHKKRHGKF